ncbi:MAG: isoleucine--tRNA ligase [Candidatus Nealsonbacteria bacterium]|nr:isoleucine--tRNA ligase [Candidatus Nealsonbacteria bacterium]
MDLNFPKIEEKILKFWQKDNTFAKSLKQRAKAPNFVFYEGPPTANGRPGIHHVLARSFKDIICRYKTMQGFKVGRKAGWDTQGLPVELEVEKKLGFKSKQEIEDYGIDKFNKECKASVWEYKKEWEKLTERIGFWLDMKNPYITYENDYMESVWWIIKQIWDKGLIYKGHKVVPYCARCETNLSSHEVALGYKNVEEESIYVRFPVKGRANTYFLAWTTTPWTLPANVAVAVNPGIIYTKIKTGSEVFILAKERLNILDKKYEVLEEVRGNALLGIEYEPLFSFVKPEKKAYFIVSGDFVSLKEGTGLVHIAPAFGVDDMEVGKKNNLPVLMTVDLHGKFKPEIKPWAGMFVKDADQMIINDLKGRNLLFKTEPHSHDYPFCWRCQRPLLYYAKEGWFIDMQPVKQALIKNNQKINWLPSHLKNGRFGEWLNEIKDWAMSRERYWGTPLPIWQCQKCKEMICIGSVKELVKKSAQKINLKDLHRPYIDKVILKCEKCKGKMQRTLEILDVWFDSGSMPFSQYHYPFENKNLQAKQFPADYICEAIDQTRGWFYTLLAISTLIGFESPYKNVISVGHVLDEKGEKMSKSKGNVVSSWDMVAKYGADSVRWYFYTINQPGEPKLFAEKDLGNTLRRFIMTLWNCVVFFQTYAKIGADQLKNQPKSASLLDKWIISKLNSLIQQVTEGLDKYDVTASARAIEKFTVEELSLWYIRRSRKRFEEAAGTLFFVLQSISKLTAPFIPFLSEEINRRLGGKKSVHLADWPKADKKLVDKELEEKMEKAREIVALALAERAKAGIKVRQPLASLYIKEKFDAKLLGLIEEEINVKKIILGKTLKLDIKITPELEEEGQVREIIRNIQEARKKANLRPQDKVEASYAAAPDLDKIIIKHKKAILAETKLKDLVFDKKITVDKQKLSLKIR